MFLLLLFLRRNLLPLLLTLLQMLFLLLLFLLCKLLALTLLPFPLLAYLLPSASVLLGEPDLLLRLQPNNRKERLKSQVSTWMAADGPLGRAS